MTPEQEKRLREIEAGIESDRADAHNVCVNLVYVNDMPVEDVEWLIALVRDEQRAARWCRKNMIFPPEVPL